MRLCFASPDLSWCVAPRSNGEDKEEEEEETEEETEEEKEDVGEENEEIGQGWEVHSVKRILMFDEGVLATLKTDYPKMSIVCGKTTAFGHLVTSLQNALGPIHHKRYKGEQSCS